MIIDPPIGPYHSVPEIEAWIRELEAQLEKHRGSDAEASVRSALEQARRWLSIRQEVSGDRGVPP